MISQRNGKKYMSDINVTPLVDVMLVLLIIFMVTAPMMMQGVKVNLPKTTSRNIKTSQEPLILTISRNKEIFIENHKLTLKNLETKIAKIFENRRDKEILLRADKDVPYGFVIKVMARVKKAGINKLGMVTEPLE
ncbi:MAG: protein TolR [Deltaproteobacteria bacterium]|nr:protein TolR [Deltaproteobacteria bacterium]MBW1927727.1 protein TolR [Deltaproteobacteria bacterium]MBW2026438.1 protein TolR [Deltaproteobacteria bacterium]MBW2126594.1 protein TolR [Deltaproteobacteria bacterium]RLB16577.1 MAG: protein TolR [Deltaproteobacteria bacterium]